MKSVQSLLFFVCVLSFVEAQAFKVGTYNIWHGLTGTGKIVVGSVESKEESEQRRVDQLKSFPELLSDLDLVFLQEVNPNSSYSKKIAGVTGHDVVAARVNCGVKIGPLGIPVNMNSGLAILANPKFKIKKLGRYLLSGSGFSSDLLCFHLSEHRAALFAEVEIPGHGTALVVNTHLHHEIGYSQELDGELSHLVREGELSPSDYEQFIKATHAGNARRKGELEKLAQIILEKRAAKHYNFVIVGGDFNMDLHELDTPDAEFLFNFENALDVVPLGSSRYNKEQVLYSWDMKRNSHQEASVRFYEEYFSGVYSKDIVDFYVKQLLKPRLIDFVYISKNVLRAPEKALLIGTEKVNGRHLSDHFGILFDIKI